MLSYKGKYEVKRQKQTFPGQFLLVLLSFFLIEVFGFFYLRGEEAFQLQQLWPLAFGLTWAGMLGSLLRSLPWRAAQISYGFLYLIGIVYSVGQSGYYQLFSEMMWLSEFRYASEGADYADVILHYPVSWFFWILVLAGLFLFNLIRFPRWEHDRVHSILSAVTAAVLAVCAFWMPQLVFLSDAKIQYANSDYGRSQSAEAAYDNMFNAHRLYEVCGLHQTLTKDIYINYLYPLTPGYAISQAEGEETIETYFEEEEEQREIAANQMTGIFEGKNVVLVLMESMDDWLLGEHTPTINRLMSEGIHFTNFYTPPYGGIRTFNTEFCINTGSFLSSQGGYAFDYVTNVYSQSLASLLTQEGYSAKTFHYNDPSFYSRGVFSLAMGYDEYVCYADYLQEGEEKKLYDDLLLFSNEGLRNTFFRNEEKTLNFIITRSAHLSYKYNDALSHWALQKYPEYRGMTESEEEDCAYLKARLVDDLFAWLMMALEDEGKLEDTVIIAVTDHYTYGVKDTDLVLERSGVEDKLLLERTPCFIWSADIESMEVDKVLNTSDLLPTMLNMLGVESDYDYIGEDAFNEDYEGFVPFSDGSWISGDVAYNASNRKILYLTEDAVPVTKEFQNRMDEKVQHFTQINNLILETDYYA